jgi:hypothetical protein
MDGKHGVYLKRIQNLRITDNTWINTHTSPTASGSFAIHLYDHQSSVNSTNALIEFNTFDTYQSCVAIGDMTAGVVRYNRLRTIYTGTSSPRFPMVLGYGGARQCDIYNNTLYGGFGSIQIRDVIGPGNRVFNNIGWGGSSLSSVSSSGATANSVLCATNIFSGVISGFSNIVDGGGNLEGPQHDPLFTSAPSDLTWGDTSPARNAGVGVASSLLDYFGTSVPQEGFRDIGFYEKPSGGSVLPTIRVTRDGPYASELGPVPQTFRFTRAENNSGAMTVLYTIGGTAVAGTHYIAFSDQVTIADGQWDATSTVTPINTGAYLGDVTVSVTLIADAAYTIIGAGFEEITIREGHTPPSNLLRSQFQPGTTTQTRRR